MIKIKTMGAGFVLTLLFAALAQAAFVLPSQITVAGRITGGELRPDVVQDGIDSAGLLPPVITLSGPAVVSLALNGTYTEQGATCTDIVDGTITVPAPTFAPALNTAVAGSYVATYTCTDENNITATRTRTVAVAVPQYAGFGPQSSTFAADNGFDFAETFDGLQTWRPSVGRIGNVHYGATSLPKLADGVTPSALDYYSSWNDATPVQDWIGAYGDSRVWRGTKSAAIDIGGVDGPSRLGLYAGDGYTDFRLFFMVNIPKNEFPTFVPSPSTLPATYIEGNPYAWYGSWKFNTFNWACPQSGCTDRETYSPDYHMLTHIKRYSFMTPPGLTMNWEDLGYSSRPVRWVKNEANLSTNIENRLGNWFGIEYHVVISATTVSYSVWMYDANGNADKIAHNNVFDLPIAAQGKKWNQFFWGGNNSGTFSWGPTMQSEYYVDDLIIDAGSKGQIGPRYFNAIGN